MEAGLTNSELCLQLSTVIDNSSHLYQAWRLFSLLLAIGRPIRPRELAARCNFFRSSSEFVEFLCSIPDSPIFLTSDRFVSISSNAFVAFVQFLLNLSTSSAFVPRSLGFFARQREWINEPKTYFRRRKNNVADTKHFPVVKRVMSCNDAGEKYGSVLAPFNKTQTDSAELHFQVKRSRSTLMQLEYSSDMTYKSDKSRKKPSTRNVFIKSNTSLVSSGIENDGARRQRVTDVFLKGKKHGCIIPLDCRYGFDNNNNENILHVTDARKEMVEAAPCQGLSFIPSGMKNQVGLREAKTGIPYFPEVDKNMIIPPGEAGHVLCDCKSPVKFAEDEIYCVGRKRKLINDSAQLPIKITSMDMHLRNPTKRNSTSGSNEKLPSKDAEIVTTHVDIQAIVSADLPSGDKEQLEKSLFKSNTIQQDAQNAGLQLFTDFEKLGNCKASGDHVEQQHCKKDCRLISKKEKLRQNDVEKRHSESKREYSNKIRGKHVSTSLKNQVELKSLPNFEFFTVEEEEGGYGTVYRARRKHDGVTLAIKCPHDNANHYHLQNEQKMLERFGGKNFVIKYEGSFKYGSADCLVLEHVEHDKPEVLRRNIDLFQLQWYGYCLFRAIACLHKQGIIHRDIKPGNFLFSRTVNKGYLIDFNLAMDLHQKYGTGMSYDRVFKHVPLLSKKSLPTAKARKFLSAKALEAVNQEARKSSQPNMLPKNLKRKIDQTKVNDSNRTTIRSQGAEGSGIITSTKDATSTRVASVQRLREPVPCQGRKELISMAQEAMQGTNHEVAITPTPKRKRISAPLEIVDRKNIYLTPMPLHSSGVSISGAGFIKSKGEIKHKKKAPCIGTKGFKAPEVLLRSPYQDPKIDVWSAGVTLVYMSTGRSPFVGEQDKNMTDIAKLKGSEALWEVARLHNRESSFPAQLLDVEYLPSKKLRDWCGSNTNRPDFFKELPRSCFDLVDRCLTVNPRLRISAEDALRHEFFSPCHEELKKQRLILQELSLSSETNLQ